jgi:hypothetical protein
VRILNHLFDLVILVRVFLSFELCKLDLVLLLVEVAKTFQLGPSTLFHGLYMQLFVLFIVYLDQIVAKPVLDLSKLVVKFGRLRQLALLMRLDGYG